MVETKRETEQREMQSKGAEGLGHPRSRCTDTLGRPNQFFQSEHFRHRQEIVQVAQSLGTGCEGPKGRCRLLSQGLRDVNYLFRPH